MQPCPTEETLARLGSDSLSGARSPALESHIDGCLICQGKLDQIVENDKVAGAAGSGVVPLPSVPPVIPGFEIERELGRGGMSIVYQAREPRLNRRVALKLVRGGPAGSHDHARWLREARSIARVRHDNVVRLYQVGEASGWLYLVLDLVPGGSLETRLEIPYDAKVAARLLESVARTVAAIHAAGILHLDLKPSNILLDGPPELPREQLTPRVSDFGIAFPWNDPDTMAGMTATGGPMGTPRYMAPEQLVGDRAAIGPAADVYGLGGLLYHALTGRPPFAAPSLVEMLEQVRNQEPVPPRRLNPAIPRDIETICLKCLQKDPRRRYASAEALAEDLDGWLKGRPIVARTISPVERVWRLCRRRPVVAALAAALALTLSTSFVAVFVLWRQADAQRIRAMAERGLAEADYKVARTALAEILELGAAGIESDRSLDRHELEGSLQNARCRMLELADPRTDDPSLWTLIALVDLFLGRSLEDEQRWPECQARFEESLVYWEKILQKNDADQNALRRRWETLNHLADVLEKQGIVEESMRFRERTIIQGDALSGLMADAEIENLVEGHIALARLANGRGDRERAESLLRLDLWPQANSRTRLLPPLCSLQLLLGRQELARNNPSGISTPGAQLDRTVEREPICMLFNAESERLSARDWAERAGAVLAAMPACTGDAAQESRIGYQLTRLMFCKAASERHAGSLNLAAKTADRMHALASILVERWPGQPAAHLALSTAYAQYYKNAYRREDRPAVETNLRLALAAAQKALLLDIGNDWSRRAVAQLEGKLKGLGSSR